MNRSILGAKVMDMWPFDEINNLRNENARLKSALLSNTEREELNFLREVSKDYVDISKDRSSWKASKYYLHPRTLKCAERDLANAKLLVATLESQMSEDAITQAHNIYYKLKEACDRQHD